MRVPDAAYQCSADFHQRLLDTDRRAGGVEQDESGRDPSDNRVLVPVAERQHAGRQSFGVDRACVRHPRRVPGLLNQDEDQAIRPARVAADSQCHPVLRHEHHVDPVHFIGHHGPAPAVRLHHPTAGSLACSHHYLLGQLSRRHGS